jgi:indole-3-glycerol phosphate synthase
MNDFLETILTRKRSEVSRLRLRATSSAGRTSPKRPFIAALDRRPELAIIAEIKKASPSKGVIRTDFNALTIAEGYVRGGAAALSVLTDEQFFKGSADYLTAVRRHTALPILRKDFIIDPLQVEETAGINADAMLLIAEALDAVQLRDLYQAALALDIDPLIELHSLSQLDKVLSLGPGAVGINNRDLGTFKTDLATTLSIIKEIPPGVVVVAESGITTAAQARMLAAAGVRALLVGEALMTAGDSSGLLKLLRLAAE